MKGVFPSNARICCSLPMIPAWTSNLSCRVWEFNWLAAQAARSSRPNLVLASTVKAGAGGGVPRATAVAPLVAVVLPGEAAGTAAGVGVSPCSAGAGAIALAAASPAPTLVGMATGAFEAWEMALADMVVGVARAREQRQ